MFSIGLVIAAVFLAAPAQAAAKPQPFSLVSAADGRCLTEVAGYNSRTVVAPCTSAQTQLLTPIYSRTVGLVTYFHLEASEDGHCMTPGYRKVSWPVCVLSDTDFTQEWSFETTAKGTVAVVNRANPDSVLDEGAYAMPDVVLLGTRAGTADQAWTVTPA